MFRTDETTVRQRMEDIRQEVEASRRKKQKKGEVKNNPIWIVLITFFRK